MDKGSQDLVSPTSSCALWLLRSLDVCFFLDDDVDACRVLDPSLGRSDGCEFPRYRRNFSGTDQAMAAI